MIKLVFFLLLSVFTAVCSFGQMVSNVDAYQEGKNIIITYDTDKEGSVGGVFCSTDGGNTWSKPLRQVTGDVNKQVQAGSHRIVWDVLSEREKLAGANICFKVEANSGRFMVNGVSFEMVRVDGGIFNMGLDKGFDKKAVTNESPAHSVTLDGYYIGKTQGSPNGASSTGDISGHGTIGSGLVGYTGSYWGRPHSRYEGSITVKVTVNARGNVIEARTISGTGEAWRHRDVRAYCERESLKSRFAVPNNRTTNGDGTITWRFK